MKKMKRAVTAMMAVAGCLMMLGGCGTKSPGTGTDETVPAGAKEVTGREEGATDEAVVRVGALKGATTMGLVKLMEENETGDCAGRYAFTMVTAADELTALVAGGKVDIALLPANVAAILYRKTEGAVSVIDINTLNVLYLVSANDSISSIEDLKGKRVYLPGKGTTPEYALRYLMDAAGLSDEDVALEFRTEATEVASILAENPLAVGLLPQPFAASALLQNEALSPVLDLGQAWRDCQGSEHAGRLVTGVTIVQNEFLFAHPTQVDLFLKEHEASIRFVKDNTEESAELIEKAGIVAKAAVAQKALPYCNIDFLSGAEMKEALGGYLAVLYAQNPAAVGNALPDDDFYYMPRQGASN